MEYTTLGRTGLNVSIAGLGAGGPSRIGQEAGLSTESSSALIHRALDLGVTFFDTAFSYRTEVILGAALADVPRDQVVLSTKYVAHKTTAARMVQAVDDALRTLKTDYLDIFHFQGVAAEDYDHVHDVLVPALMRERDRGKFRFLGITETTSTDRDHVMFRRALDDDCWDVIMTAFNMMHQSALDHVLPTAKERGVGTLIMAPARFMVSTPVRMAQALKTLAEEGALPPSFADADDPLGFLVHEGGADSLMDATYRFVRHASGADVVLFGTSSLAHLEANVASLLKPPLPTADMDRIRAEFGHLKGIGLYRGKPVRLTVR